MRRNTIQDAWERIDIRGIDECWLWTGRLTTSGYGAFSINGGHTVAHRVIYTAFNGDIDEGMVVMHSCDNRQCCNPRHLIAGTVAENNLDCIEKGRHVAPSGEANGRCRLSDEQVAEIRSSGEGHRAIARRYGVSDRQVRRIRSGEHRSAEAAIAGEGEADAS